MVGTTQQQYRQRWHNNNNKNNDNIKNGKIHYYYNIYTGSGDAFECIQSILLRV